jgi:cobalamin synthase
MAITIVFTLIFVRFATKLLGGLSGDSLGATNEITRAITMLAMVLI